jgi:hypothetical protein
MLLPKFSYDAGSGTVNFTPTYPPINKPLSDELEASRHDSITTSGVKQSITDRVDSFITIEFSFVPQADIAAWKAFFAWTLPGGRFTYYPDATVSGTHTDYTIEEASWVPKRTVFGHTGFKFRMRQWV